MSLFSESWQDRERSKTNLEKAGALAFKQGLKKWDNPHVTQTQRNDMKEFAPWTPPLADNQTAYYWEIGWENAEAGEDYGV